MPYSDGTGPLGMGAMSGRGAGLCAGYAAPGYMNSFGNRGCLGMSGRRNRFFAKRNFSAAARYCEPVGNSQTAPIDYLLQRAAYLEDMLADIKTRISKIQSQGKASDNGEQ